MYVLVGLFFGVSRAVVGTGCQMLASDAAFIGPPKRGGAFLLTVVRVSSHSVHRHFLYSPREFGCTRLDHPCYTRLTFLHG